MTSPNITADLAYEKLKERFANVLKLDGLSNLLFWDTETQMPKGGIETRGEQSGLLAKLAHEQLSAKETEEFLEIAWQGKDKFSPDDQRNLHLMQKKWLHMMAPPVELTMEVDRLGSEGSFKHTQYGKKGDWETMRPWYQHSFDTTKKMAEIKAKEMGFDTPYDALLDVYCPGEKTASLEPLFAKLAGGIGELLPKVLKKQETDKPIEFSGTFARDQQKALLDDLIARMGFNLDKGRLDFIDGHPFSAGGSDDNRITSDCDENDFLVALSTVMHEAGHGMYTQGLPADLRWQPVGDYLGMGIHETQSMVMEKSAGKTIQFFKFLEKQARQYFDRPDDPALDALNLQKLLCKAAPSLIRIKADDLTYPAHVMLRFNIEKAIINGEAKVDDIPDLWSKYLDEYLGINYDHPKNGYLQDVHWPAGLIGYFPAYTIGALGAAQFFKAACDQQPEILPQLEKGDFQALHQWLIKNVHGQGCRYDAKDLFVNATGKPLDCDAFLEQIERNYLLHT